MIHAIHVQAFLTVTLFWFSQSEALGYSLDVKCPSETEVAKIFIEAEASGTRHMGKRSCAKTIAEKYKAMLNLGPSTPSEGGFEVHELSRIEDLTQEGEITVSTVEKTFRQVLIKAKTKTGKIIRDRFVFSYLGSAKTDEEKKALTTIGCANLVFPPNHFYVATSCK